MQLFGTKSSTAFRSNHKSISKTVFCLWNPRFNPGLRWSFFWLSVALLWMTSSCRSRLRNTGPAKHPLNHNLSIDSSSLPESRKADEKPTSPSPADLEKSWLQILGRKDYLRGDLKMEGNWNITYNETQIASPVIMLVRPQHFIYLSIRPALGIEMLRIILRPDSLWMISRLNKNYWSGTWAELEPSLGMSLDYRWFQDALLHGHRSLIDRAVLGGLSPSSSGEQRIRFENIALGTSLGTSPQGKRNATFQAEWGRWPSKIHQLKIQASSGSLQMDYLKIFETESASLPAQMTFDLQIPRNQALLEMHWKEPKIQAVELPTIKIPEDYRKLKINP